jgi:hypothetical protein
MSNGNIFPKDLYICKEAIGFSVHEELDFFEMGEVKLVGTYRLLRTEKISKVLSLQHEEIENGEYNNA